MNIFKPPQSKYADVFDIGRFNFMWRLYVIMSMIFTGLTALHLIENDIPNVLITTAAFTIIVVSLIITKFTGKYIFGALFGGLFGTLINQADLFLVVGSQKAVTLLWIICIVLYVFYLLGPKWGVIALILNLTGVAASIVFIPKEVMIENIASRDTVDLVSIIINFVVIVFVLAYLMNQILKSSRSAEKKSRLAQDKLKEQYNVVQHQNEEKTVMLREIHHRVKNNLQIITSLLRLQSQEINDPKVLEHFDEAIQRVLSMALIHEKMYQSKELSKIDLEAYLRTLIEELIESYSIDKPIDLRIKCDVDYIQPKSLVSFALMFNELVTNSLKHAFSDVPKAQLHIDIEQLEQGETKITYFDNGAWKPPQREGSFGVQLIDDLCEQLDGTYELNTENGTTYTFHYKSMGHSI